MNMQENACKSPVTPLVVAHVDAVGPLDLRITHTWRAILLKETLILCKTNGFDKI